MISVIDIGNTSLKLFNYENDTIVNSKYIYNEEINYNELVKEFGEIIIISSVVDNISSELIKRVPLTKKVKIISHNEKFLFDFSNYKPINSIGIDRLLALQGAIKDAYDKNIDYEYLVAVTIGTATTINVVNSYFEFIGGMIFPGPQTMIKSLNSSTAKLPDVDLIDLNTDLALSTEKSIISGVINSISSTIFSVKYKLNTDDIKYYITGGYAYLFKDLIKDAIFDDYLIAKGLLTFKNL
ncbi:MAG TPA: type III pantothenate kinase [Ignavibacteriales bacterium]|nr:type III pantothenate kinase [Ignavibacteriales bacterium]